MPLMDYVATSMDEGLEAHPGGLGGGSRHCVVKKASILHQEVLQRKQTAESKVLYDGILFYHQNKTLILPLEYTRKTIYPVYGQKI